MTVFHAKGKFSSYYFAPMLIVFDTLQKDVVACVKV